MTQHAPGFFSHSIDSESPDGVVLNDSSNHALLAVNDLRTHVFSKRGIGRAVDGASFSVHRGEAVGLVGESGSGKTMTAMSILRLNPEPATRIVGGEIIFDGQDLTKLTEQEMRGYRGSRISMVLQDPATALNPVLRVGPQLYEPIRLHQGLNGSEMIAQAIEALRLFRIPAPEKRLQSYPHELSGGMRQRVVGAIALSCEPDLLIADEPTTALDVTTQLAYLDVLKDIQTQRKLALLFITHDLGIVARLCDRVAVMYSGKIVEIGDVFQIFDNPAHPYTKALLSSLPDVGREADRLLTIEGHPPSIHEAREGCSFAPRCPLASDECRVDPAETTIEPGHKVRCWKAGA